MNSPSELAVDAREQVHVEGGGHPDRIVVGEQDLGLRLLQVGRRATGDRRDASTRAPAAGTGRRPAGRNCRWCRRGTAPAGADRATIGRHLAQAFQVLALEARPCSPSRAAGARARPARGPRPRCRSGSRRWCARVGERLQDPARLARASAAELGDQHRATAVGRAIAAACRSSSRRRRARVRTRAAV